MGTHALGVSWQSMRLARSGSSLPVIPRRGTLRWVRNGRHQDVVEHTARAQRRIRPHGITKARVGRRQGIVPSVDELPPCRLQRLTPAAELLAVLGLRLQRMQAAHEGDRPLDNALQRIVEGEPGVVHPLIKGPDAGGAVDKERKAARRDSVKEAARLASMARGDEAKGAPEHALRVAAVRALDPRVCAERRTARLCVEDDLWPAEGGQHPEPRPCRPEVEGPAKVEKQFAI